MPHVELSLTDAPAGPHLRPVRGIGSGVGRWAAAATGAEEPCLVLDVHATIVSASPSCAALIGIGEASAAVGHRLRDAMSMLVDFTAARSRLEDVEAERIPPLLAISSGLMARGLIRLLSTAGQVTTLDAISAPLREGSTVTGSLTFFTTV